MNQAANTEFDLTRGGKVCGRVIATAEFCTRTKH